MFKDPIDFNAQGLPRDAGEFWKLWKDQNPNSLSPRNQFLVDNYDRFKTSPRIDQTWIDVFPEHSGYMNDVLLHHHVNHGAITIPVPKQTHLGSGGPWHSK